MTSIESLEDIVVDRPVPRETIRAVERGFLVTCTSMHCDWQGLFPDPDLAATAAERHYDHDRRNGQYHFGDKTYTVVELLDASTACTLDESSLGLSVAENRLCTVDGGVREWEFPRTTEDVSKLVERGDKITRPHPPEAVVCNVAETRSHGLPTWTVVYVDPDVELDAATKSDFYWLNELVAQDGNVYTSFGPDPLSAPEFEVIGQAEHQADLAAFADVAGGEKA